MFNKFELISTPSLKSENHKFSDDVKAIKVNRFSYRSTLEFETISGNWKPFKNDEKFFYLMFKTLFVRKIFTFLSRLFGHAK